MKHFLLHIGVLALLIGCLWLAGLYIDAVDPEIMDSLPAFFFVYLGIFYLTRYIKNKTATKKGKQNVI